MTFQSKHEAFDALEATRSEWLAAARSWARAFARHGQTITVNDIRQYGPKLPDGIDGRVMGAVFNSGEWENLGYTKSARRVSHCRSVCRFRLVGAGND